MLLFLKLADVLTLVLLRALHKSDHPLARRLLTPVDPPRDYASMKASELRATSWRMAAFAAACTLPAALLALFGRRLPSHLAVQIPVIILGVTLVIAAFMFLLNAAHFAVMALGQKRRMRGSVAGVSPTRPA